MYKHIYIQEIIFTNYSYLIARLSHAVPAIFTCMGGFGPGRNASRSKLICQLFVHLIKELLCVLVLYSNIRLYHASTFWELDNRWYYRFNIHVVEAMKSIKFSDKLSSFHMFSVVLCLCLNSFTIGPLLIFTGMIKCQIK